MKSIHPHLGAALAALGLTLAATAACAGPAGAAEELRALHDQERQRVQLYKAYFPDAATGRKAAISFHANLLEANYGQGFLVLELDGAEIAQLRQFGFRVEHAPDYVAKRDERLKAIAAAAQQRSRAGLMADTQSIPGFACYETVAETFAAGDAMVASHPKLARWVDIGDSWEKTRGLGGEDMRVLKLGNAAVGGRNKPKLFINSAIHAREYTTAPLALALARWLIDGYGKNADATWLLDHHEVHLLLHSNPDGRKLAETGLSWRKNTNRDYCGATSNQRGADLNRNFSFTWNSTGGAGSSGDECAPTYRGRSAASEPEVKAMEHYIRSLWPDRRGPGLTDPAPADTSGLHLDLHSYSRLVLWPWGETATKSGNADQLQTLGRRFAYYNGYSPQQSIGLYPTEGTTDGPSYGELGVPSYTFELGDSFFESCEDYNRTIKPDNLPALIYAAKVAGAPYITPAGPDVLQPSLDKDASGAGVPAGERVTLTASVTDTRFNNSNGVEPTQAIAAAEAYIDTPPWLEGATPVPLAAADGGFDTATETVRGTLDTASLKPGQHIVFVRGRDAAGVWGPISAVFLKVAGGPPDGIRLSLASQRRPWGGWQVDVSWSGARGSSVDLYRNGVSLGASRNDGSHREMRSSGTWRYQVCESGARKRCSAEQSIRF
ncbi:M14 family metallopeptidase [Eleftheria terrae]|uniref:M14 family metallopeptidase n=1 Tax=Eleftheria terrae TaxID=1597781 RepID=UPI00263BDF01|nr:M14 family metallopeptidase [Eleftheria terrae]WKB54995.1 M14 family metallopeptidase [Eleftheria terrae]